MFNKNFACTWTYMSGLLGFPETCHVDIDNALNDFDRNRLWKDISGLGPPPKKNNHSTIITIALKI